MDLRFGTWNVRSLYRAGSLITFAIEISLYNFPLQNSLKQRDALSPMLFNFASEYAFRNVQENQVGLKSNGKYQLVLYADDVNLVGDNIDTIKKNTETLVDANKEVDLEVNAEKTKYMLLSRHQNAGQNHNTKIPNRSFENAAQLKYFGNDSHRSKFDS
jgi:hypothetical protein